MTTPQREHIVLACSGGLDTSVAVGWIAEETVAEGVALDVRDQRQAT